MQASTTIPELGFERHVKIVSSTGLTAARSATRIGTELNPTRSTTIASDSSKLIGNLSGIAYFEKKYRSSAELCRQNFHLTLAR